ncbi:MAG: LURP-one-related family protein [Firmicutes bacterium]|nr:LURP-one-related family protein [Bacillota bacterium]
MFLYLKQKVFTIADRLTFYDQNQQVVYKVKGSLFKIPPRLNITDAAGADVIQVKKKLFRFFRTYGIVDLANGSEIGTIKRKFSLNKNFKITVGEQNLKIAGSLFGFEFNVVNEQGESLVNVKKKYISWGDSYEVFIDETRLEPPVACAICVAFDHAVHNQKRKNRSFIR